MMALLMRSAVIAEARQVWERKRTIHSSLDNPVIGFKRIFQIQDFLVHNCVIRRQPCAVGHLVPRESPCVLSLCYSFY
jgi:hypothetical protein